MPTVLITTTGAGTWTVPRGITSVDVELVGAGGGGGDDLYGTNGSGGGATTFGTLEASGGGGGTETETNARGGNGGGSQGGAGGYSLDGDGVGGLGGGGATRNGGDGENGQSRIQDSPGGVSGSQSISGLSSYGAGGAGNYASGIGAPGGGGGGGYTRNARYAVTAGDTISYSVGAGGTSGFFSDSVGQNGVIRLTYSFAIAPSFDTGAMVGGALTGTALAYEEFVPAEGSGLTLQFSVGRPHGFAHAEFVASEWGLSRPRGQTHVDTFTVLLTTVGSGTWTVPVGVTSLDVQLVAGGGGGGRSQGGDGGRGGGATTFGTLEASGGGGGGTTLGGQDGDDGGGTQGGAGGAGNAGTGPGGGGGGGGGATTDGQAGSAPAGGQSGARAVPALSSYGGGGAGAHATFGSFTLSGGGGGGGGYTRGATYAVTLGARISYTVGAGGASGGSQIQGTSAAAGQRGAIRVTFTPSVIAIGIAAQWSPGRPIGFVPAIGRPITAQFSVGRPFGFIPAIGRGVTAAWAVGRPRGFFPKIAASGVSAHWSLGRPHAFAHAEFVAASWGVGRPLGFFPKLAASGLTATWGAGKPEVYAHAAAITARWSVSRPNSYRFGVPGSRESAALAFPTPNFSQGIFHLWQGLSLSDGRYSFSGNASITQQRFNFPGISAPAAWASGGTLTLTADNGSLTLPGDSTGIWLNNTPERQAWVTAFLALDQDDATLRLRFDLFQANLPVGWGVGDPRGFFPKVAAYGRTAQWGVGRPTRLIAGEFDPVTTQWSVGRPAGDIPVKVGTPRALTAGWSVGHPYALARAEPVAAEWSTGRPDGRIARVGVPGSHSETGMFSLGIPDTSSASGKQWFTRVTGTGGFANRFAIIQPSGSDYQFQLFLTAPSSWRTGGSVTLTSQNGSLTLPARADSLGSTTWTLSSAEELAWAVGFMALDQADSALDFSFSEFVPGISHEWDTGRPHAFAHAEFVAAEWSVGRPAADIPIVVGQPRALVANWSLGRPHAFAHAEFVAAAFSVSRPIAQVKRAVGAITAQWSGGRPDGVKRRVAVMQPVTASWGLSRPITQVKRAVLPRTVQWTAADPAAFIFGVPIRAQFTTDLGAAGRIASGHTLWRWDGLSVTPPVPVGDGETITSIRIRSDQIRIFRSGGVRAGLSADFLANGELIFTSPSIGRIVIEMHDIDEEGRYDPSSHPEWAAWWSAFTAADDNPLTITFLLRALSADWAVSRPVVSVSHAVDGITANWSLSRPHAFAHAEFIAAYWSVGRPRGFFPKLAASGLTATWGVTRPSGQTANAGESITAEWSVSRPEGLATREGAPNAITAQWSLSHPHAFAHAEFVAAYWSLGRPVAQVKRAAESIAARWIVGDPIVQVKRAVNAVTTHWSLSRPLHYLRSVAASGITAQWSVSRPEAKAVTAPEAITAAWGVSRPFGYVVEPQAIPLLAAWFDIQSYGFRWYPPADERPAVAAQFAPLGTDLFFANITVRRDRAGAVFHFEDNQTTFAVGNGHDLSSRFENTGFFEIEVNGERIRFPIGTDKAEPYRIDLSGDEATDFLSWRGDNFPTTGQLEGTLYLDDGLPRQRVGLPGAVTANWSLGRPHAFAHAEFVAAEWDTGRPRGFVPKIAASGVTAHWGVGRPHAFAHAEFVAAEWDTGRPRGFFPKLAASGLTAQWSLSRPAVVLAGDIKPVTAQWSVSRPLGEVLTRVGLPQALTANWSLSRPHAFAHAEFVAADWDTGAPIAQVKRAVTGITANWSLSHPHAFAHAEFVAAYWSLGRPIGFFPKLAASGLTARWGVGRPDGVKRRVAVAQPITASWGISRPIAQVKRAASAITARWGLGNPRGFFPKIAASGMTANWSLSQPHAFAHAEFVLAQWSVGRPLASIRRAAQALTVRWGLSRPHAFAHAEFVAAYWSTSRPQAYLGSVAASGLTAQWSLSRPEREHRRDGEAITTNWSVSRPQAYLQSVAGSSLQASWSLGRPESERRREGVGTAITARWEVARPITLVARAAEPLTAQWALGKPHIFAHGTTVTVDWGVGRPHATPPAHVDFITVAWGTGRPYVSAAAVGISIDWRVTKPADTTRRERDPAAEARAEGQAPAAVYSVDAQEALYSVTVQRPVG